MIQETARFLLVSVLLLAILAAAYRPKLLPLIAMGGFLAFYGPVMIHRLQSWNVFHYWLNTKYVEEVGFKDFYSCAYEAAPDKFGGVARNLYTYEYEPLSALPPCPKENFTQARWQEFTQDLAWLQAQPARSYIWESVMRDKGLNTTPTWLALAGRLANAFPAGSVGWWGLLYSDFILLAIGLGFIALVRGPQIASLMTIFLFTWIGTAPQLMGHWFQYVWLFLCLVGAGAWHKKWYAIAGAALAMAGALRIFPAVLFVWPVMHWRKVPKMFWGGAGVAGLAALIVGSTGPLGLAVWPQFINKMLLHSQHLVIEPGNIGLRNLIAMASNPAAAMAVWEAFAMGETTGITFPASPGWSWAAVIVASGLMLSSIGKQKKMSFSSGLPVLFFGVTVSSYYYGLMALSFDDADRNEVIILLAISLVFFILMYWLHPLISHSVGQFILLCYLYWKVNK